MERSARAVQVSVQPPRLVKVFSVMWADYGSTFRCCAVPVDDLSAEHFVHVLLLLFVFAAGAPVTQRLSSRASTTPSLSWRRRQSAASRFVCWSTRSNRPTRSQKRAGRRRNATRRRMKNLCQYLFRCTGWAPSVSSLPQSAQGGKISGYVAARLLCNKKAGYVWRAAFDMMR